LQKNSGKKLTYSKKVTAVPLPDAYQVEGTKHLMGERFCSECKVLLPENKRNWRQNRFIMMILDTA